VIKSLICPDVEENKLQHLEPVHVQIISKRVMMMFVVKHQDQEQGTQKIRSAKTQPALIYRSILNLMTR